MAIYHLHAAIVSRGKGHSVVAKAAYRAAEKLIDERTGEVKDYRRRQGVEFAGIYAPKNAPDWARDRGRLWNEVERIEDTSTRHATAQLAREIEVSLPHEFTPEQRRYLVEDFVKENFTRKGLVADVAIHEPHRRGDSRNYHAHILVTTRTLDADGFSETKPRDLNSKTVLRELRESWARHANRHLERWGHPDRIDARTLAAQGIDREPTIKMGEKATELERRGVHTERGDINRAIAERNAERESLSRDAIVVDFTIARHDQTAKPTKVELNRTAGEIRLAYSLSSSAQSFVDGLNARTLFLARVTQQDIDRIAQQRADSLKQGRRPPPKLIEGELVVVARKGTVYFLNERTTGDTRAETHKFLSTFERTALPDVDAAARAQLMLAADRSPRLRAPRVIPVSDVNVEQRSFPDHSPDTTKTHHGNVPRADDFVAEHAGADVADLAESVLGLLVGDAEPANLEQHRDAAAVFRQLQKQAAHQRALEQQRGRPDRER